MKLNNKGPGRVRMPGGKLVVEMHWEEQSVSESLDVRPADETVFMLCTVRGADVIGKQHIEVVGRSNPVTRAQIMLNKNQTALRARLESFQEAIAGFFEVIWKPKKDVNLSENDDG